MKKFLILIMFLLAVSSVMAFDPIAVSNPSYSTDGVNFAKYWLLTVAETGRAGSAVGTIQPQSISDGTKTAKYPLTLETSISDQKCKYDISTPSSRQVLYRLDIQEVSPTLTENVKLALCFGSLSCINDYASSIIMPRACPNTIGFKKLTGSFDFACLTRTQEGVKANIVNKRFSFKETITATVNGETATGVISNDPSVAPKEVSVSNRIFVKFLGGLTNFEECPTAESQEVLALHMNDWKLVDSNKLNDALNNYQVAYDCVGQKALFADMKSICIDAYNSKVNLATVPKQFKATTGSSAVASCGSGDCTSTGVITLSDVKLLQIPTLSMKINADWIGIVEPQVKPKIVSATFGSCFEEGTTGQISVQVKNEGTMAGSVSFSINCGTGFSGDKQIDNLQLGTGKTATRVIDVTASITQDSTAKCTLRVQDANNDQNFDSKEVSVCAKRINPCGDYAVGTTRCNNNILEVCKADGWVLQKNCPVKCELISGVAQCSGAELECESDAACKVALNDDNPCTIEYCKTSLFSSTGKCEQKASEALECKGCKPLWKLPDSFLGWTMLPALSADCVKTLDILAMIMSLVIAGFAIYMLYKGFERGKILKKKGWRQVIKPIIFIIVGLVTYAVSFKLIWYGIIAIAVVAVLAGALYMLKPKFLR